MWGEIICFGRSWVHREIGDKKSNPMGVTIDLICSAHARVTIVRNNVRKRRKMIRFKLDVLFAMSAWYDNVLPFYCATKLHC